MKSRSNIVFRVLAVIILFAALAFAAGLLLRFTNGGNEEFKTFYLEYEGKQILSSAGKYVLPGEGSRFDVKYTFDFATEDKSYTVKVVPNADADFPFTVDGQPEQWQYVKDVTAAFTIEQADDHFILSAPDYGRIATVLQALYLDAAVVVENACAINRSFPFLLVVSNYNASVEYCLQIGFVIPVTDLQLSDSSIIF